MITFRHEIMRPVEVLEMTLLDDLDRDTLKAIESLAVTKSYPKNSIIINQGDDTDAFYLVLSGRAVVVILHEDGRQIVLGTLCPGDYFGELSCLDGDIRSATILTKEPCKCLVISKDRFQNVCSEHPSLIWVLIRDLVQKLRRATHKIEELAFTDVYGRVVRFLGENQETKTIEHKLTHQDIAHAVGASREMVSRVMKELALQGYIKQAKGRITILREILPDDDDC
jgi:CRP/FNR family cyclic AMP-dependent transcriptional regulator